MPIDRIEFWKRMLEASTEEVPPLNPSVLPYIKRTLDIIDEMLYNDDVNNDV